MNKKINIFILVMVHTKVYNKDDEFVPACREPVATNGKNGKGTARACLLKTRTSTGCRS